VLFNTGCTYHTHACRCVAKVDGRACAPGEALSRTPWILCFVSRSFAQGPGHTESTKEMRRLLVG